MSRRATSLLALRAFEAAARRLSFTNAAQELYVSQAAISRHVRMLEADLGRPLFRRLHRQVELTAAGRRLATELAVGFSHIWRAVEAVRGAPARRLRISVETAFAARWLVPRFGRFTAAYPDIEVDLDSSDELRTVGRDTDIAIRFLRSASRKPKARARKLFVYEAFPVTANSASSSRPRRRSDSDVLAFAFCMTMTAPHGGAGSPRRGSRASIRRSTCTSMTLRSCSPPRCADREWH
jgi:LysR family glycine cleavage system transcriptional activator